jgi:LysM repeat protein
MAITYTVKEGDTLYAISRRYNTSIEELRIVNSLPTDTIVLKQKLKVNVRWP